jgi:hypothetical protein
MTNIPETFPEKLKNNEIPHSDYPVTGPIFEPEISYVRSRDITHSTATTDEKFFLSANVEVKWQINQRIQKKPHMKLTLLQVLRSFFTSCSKLY